MKAFIGGNDVISKTTHSLLLFYVTRQNGRKKSSDSDLGISFVRMSFLIHHHVQLVHLLHRPHPFQLLAS